MLNLLTKQARKSKDKMVTLKQPKSHNIQYCWTFEIKWLLCIYMTIINKWPNVNQAQNLATTTWHKSQTDDQYQPTTDCTWLPDYGEGINLFTNCPADMKTLIITSWVVTCRWSGWVRGMLGNKCAGQQNLKTVNCLRLFLGMIITNTCMGVFCSALSTTGRRLRTHT